MENKKKKKFAEDFASGLLKVFARLLKEFGPEFLIPVGIREYRSYLSGDQYGFALVVSDFHHQEKTFQGHDGGYFMIRATKPEPRHGKSKEIKGIKRMLGVKAFHVGELDRRAEKQVVAFCRRHASQLKKLNLRGPEDIGILSESVRFRWIGMDPVALRPRFEAFARLLSEMGGTSTPPPKPILFEREWRLKFVPKSKLSSLATPHRFGGTLEHPVACQECDEATNLIAEIDLGDRALPKTPMRRLKLPIFSCLSCLSWGPAFYDVSGKLPTPLTADGRPLKRKKKLPQNEEDLAPHALTLSRVPKARKTGASNKLGGKPVWVQGGSTPACPRCRQVMTFALQLASNSEVDFGDAGSLYTFVCAKCKVVASLIESY